MSEATIRSLLARGFRSTLAEQLVSDGLTVSALKGRNDDELRQLGLSKDELDSLRSSRPPIPRDIVIRLLYDCKRTCCICRDPDKPVIIHHIVEWAKSHDHSESNLAVLCLVHHDQAHTKKMLSLALKPDQIRGAKTIWIELIKTQDAKALLNLASVAGARWDFINLQRLFELAIKLKVSFRSCRSYANLRKYGMLDARGMLEPANTWPQKPRFYYYHVEARIHLYSYVSNILDETISRLPIVDLTNRWSATEVEALVKPGTWVAVQAAFYFKSLTRQHDRRGQYREGYRTRSHIRIEFEFDAWEATSSSSRSGHLRGHQTALCILHCRTISKSKHDINISTSCLSIGGRFEDQRPRAGGRPPPSALRYLSDDQDEGSTR